MPRLAGIDLPAQKKVFIGLTSIYGIGRANVQTILIQAKVDGDKRIKDLTGEEVGRLQKVLDSYVIEGTLRQDIRDNIERLRRTGTYRGVRHTRGLPVRGQRTRTNGRTRRGRRHTVGAMTKEMAAKLDEAKKK